MFCSFVVRGCLFVRVRVRVESVYCIRVGRVCYVRCVFHQLEPPIEPTTATQRIASRCVFANRGNVNEHFACSPIRQRILHPATDNVNLDYVLFAFFAFPRAFAFGL